MKKIHTTYKRQDDVIWRVKTENLTKVLAKENLGSFEKHMIQEGIKQILFADGTEESMYEIDGNTWSARQITPEMINFLLDYDVIGE